jgi:signal transduction histidine kinase
MTFNLAYHVALRRRGETWYVPMTSMAVNTVLVTAVLRYSGGSDSPFWPMYLIPIFTSCLYLTGRHVAFATASAGAFLACLYLSKTEPDSPLQWAIAELTIKLAVLVVSASVTAQYAFRERRARTELAATRSELERLAAELERADLDRHEAGGGMTRFLAGLVYDLNGRLTLIRGRSDLLGDGLAEDSPQAADARGIAEAARALSHLGSDLLRVLKRGEEEIGPCALAPLLDQVLNLSEYRLRQRRLKLVRDVAAELPPVRVGAPHLQQALLELLEIATEKTRVDGTISASAKRLEDEVQVRLSFEVDGESAPPSPVPQRRLLEFFGGGVEALGMGRSCEYVVRLPLGSAVRRP